MNYNITFDLTGTTPKIVLDDITDFGATSPTSLSYELKVTYPGGYVQTKKASSIPSNKKIEMTMDVLADNFPPKGEYKFTYTTNYDGIATLDKIGSYAYIRPKANLFKLFDEYTPTLKVQDQTDYGVQNFSLSSSTRTITGSNTFLNQSVTSSTTILDLKFNNNYYDSALVLSLTNSLLYVSNLSNWLYISDRITQSYSASPDVPPEAALLLGYLKQYKSDMDAQEGVNLTEYNRYKDSYVLIISILEHAMSRSRQGDTVGLTTYIQQIYRLLVDFDYMQNVDTNAIISPYNFDIFVGIDWTLITNKPFVFTNPTNKQILLYDSATSKWVNSEWGYVHTQTSPSLNWTITHNLNKYPSVTIVDSAGTVVEGDIAYSNTNAVVVTFSSTFSGKAYFN
jgi:hypothetical protein